ncbi:hypothetical protein SMICM17S_09073 [Streptomyces microflavus]
MTRCGWVPPGEPGPRPALQPGSEQDAADVAMDAAHDLAPLATPAATALRGALELVAVVAQARARRPWAARERLAAAAVPLARQTGESNVHWTVFGPTNVMLHAVNVQMTDGDATEGLRLADRIDATKMPSRERQFTFAGRARDDLRRDDAAVLVHLLELEQLAPETCSAAPSAASSSPPSWTGTAHLPPPGHRPRPTPPAPANPRAPTPKLRFRTAPATRTPSSGCPESGRTCRVT